MPFTDRLRRALVGGVVGLLALTGCHVGNGSTDPTPTPGATPRPFTVMSTDRIRVTDPAAMTDAGSAVLAVNVFQRLMTADPGQPLTKPDAAQDCRFTTATTFTCTLKRDLVFSNGHALTSSDVKFSIERAARLKVPGSSVSLLGTFRRIETPDDVTVRFILSQPDTQFVLALASPAASIVDEETYDADSIASPKDPIVGSGPFAVASFDGDELMLKRNDDYTGRTPTRLPELIYRTVPDSASIEDAMTKGTVDVVWRGLDAAAVTRLSQQVTQNPDGQTTAGFRQTVLTGTRVLQLEWTPTARIRANKAVRQAIAVALQGDRTSDSIVPGGVRGNVPSFPLGGKVKPKITWKNRINLTLSYDSTAPNSQDIATQIRTRLENAGGLSVQLRGDDPQADLVLMDRKAWTATALAWMQPYVDSPLAASKEAIDSGVDDFRASTDDAAADRLLAALQRQATLDLTVLPISQSDEIVYTVAGTSINAASYGPGWQLGLWGVGRD